MLPAHLAENIRKQVLFYLQSTFDFREREVDKAFERFLGDAENGLFKGPWVLLRRPYRPADVSETVPFDFPVQWRPFKHQYRSWRRLFSKGQQPKPTLVTTGTGSGKTECFLYPILDHCLRARSVAGIKAIVLYPMNALAADQEKRFARVIWRTPELKAAGIRVGNYTGRYDPSEPGAGAESGDRVMGEDHGISHHETQQENPPDILLTNYKMLDYLLLRPQDQRLWRFNEPGVLRYLVLDELHTYDGAQGADVACLIRRLKERLDIPKGELCVVGTSATLDDREAFQGVRQAKVAQLDAQETGSDRLARFASTLFEEEIPMEAVIGEDRLTVEEIITPSPKPNALPAPDDCLPRDDEDVLSYTHATVGALGRAGLLPGQHSGRSRVPGQEEGDLTAEERSVVRGARGMGTGAGRMAEGRASCSSICSRSSRKPSSPRPVR
jgi:DEAD/DEAH box helicase domain-containing protein